MTMDRGEMITILSREGKEGWLVRDSKGNEELVPTIYITEVESTVRIQFHLSSLSELFKLFNAVWSLNIRA